MFLRGNIGTAGRKVNGRSGGGRNGGIWIPRKSFAATIQQHTAKEFRGYNSVSSCTRVNGLSNNYIAKGGADGMIDGFAVEADRRDVRRQHDVVSRGAAA